MPDHQSLFSFPPRFLLQPAFDSPAAAFLITTTLPPLALFLSCLKCRLLYTKSPAAISLLWCFSNLRGHVVFSYLFTLSHGWPPPAACTKQASPLLRSPVVLLVERLTRIITFTTFYPLFKAPTFSCIFCSALAVSPLGFGAVQILLGWF